MYKAVVFSVPGTGTRFICKFLQDSLGYTEIHGIDQLLAMDRETVFWSTHNWRAMEPLVNYHGSKMVVPLRDPYRAYLTRRHAYPYDEGARTHMASLWKILMDGTEGVDVAYLPIDAPNVDKHLLLQSIAIHLDCGYDTESLDKIATQWLRIGSRGPSAARDEYENAKLIGGEHVSFLKTAQDWYFDKVGILEKL